jgi:hypothetical protein
MVHLDIDKLKVRVKRVIFGRSGLSETRLGDISDFRILKPDMDRTDAKTYSGNDSTRVNNDPVKDNILDRIRRTVPH